METTQAIAFLSRHLEDQGEEDAKIGVESEGGIEFLTYSGETDIFGQGKHATIHTLTMLDRRDDKDAWVGYLTLKCDEHTIAGAVCCTTHGEYVDLPDEYQARLWVSQGETPPEVAASLRKYIAAEVARDFATQITMLRIHLAEHMQHLPMEGRKHLAESIQNFTKEVIL